MSYGRASGMTRRSSVRGVWIGLLTTMAVAALFMVWLWPLVLVPRLLGTPPYAFGTDFVLDAMGFILAILLAISGGLVGLGILNMYPDLSYGTRFGLGVLAAIMPGGYLLVISSLLFPDPTLFKQIGCIIYGVGLLVGLLLHIDWLRRASRKTLDVESNTPFLP